MKAQVTIIQFIMFFILGLIVFTSTGAYFKYQSDLLKSQVSSSTLQLLNNYVTTLAVEDYNGCKQCGFINTTSKIYNTTADYVVQMQLGSTSLSVVTQPPSTTVTSSLANLYYSLTYTPSSSVSTQGITLTYDKNKNSIVMQ